MTCSALLVKEEPVTGHDVLAAIERHIPRAEKQAAAVAELLALVKSPDAVDPGRLDKILQADKYNLEIGGRRYPGRQIEKLACRRQSQPVSHGRRGILPGVGMIRNDNAQKEYYITDMVRLLSGVRHGKGERRYRVRAVAVDRPEWVQSFNSPDDLLAIQDYVRQQRLDGPTAPAAVNRPQLKPTQYATVRQWLAKLEAGRPALRRWLTTIYGRHEELHQQKCKDLRGVLECYGKRFGFDSRVCIVRRRAG